MDIVSILSLVVSLKGVPNETMEALKLAVMKIVCYVILSCLLFSVFVGDYRIIDLDYISMLHFLKTTEFKYSFYCFGGSMLVIEFLIYLFKKVTELLVRIIYLIVIKVIYKKSDRRLFSLKRHWISLMNDKNSSGEMKSLLEKRIKRNRIELISTRLKYYNETDVTRNESISLVFFIVSAIGFNYYGYPFGYVLCLGLTVFAFLSLCVFTLLKKNMPLFMRGAVKMKYKL
ncbi:MAG: hypothetical protein JWM14_87 [Chitinophagaceae bacterium]|nr:hypothetical protein [Chitinophagaceae bacterium]